MKIKYPQIQKEYIGNRVVRSGLLHDLQKSLVQSKNIQGALGVSLMERFCELLVKRFNLYLFCMATETYTLDHFPGKRHCHAKSS
jgi:hypothetical protein